MPVAEKIRASSEAVFLRQVNPEASAPEVQGERGMPDSPEEALIQVGLLTGGNDRLPRWLRKAFF
jgi:hypothetical protein